MISSCEILLVGSTQKPGWRGELVRTYELSIMAENRLVEPLIQKVWILKTDTNEAIVYLNTI